jgi:hypothetical protein
MKPLSHTLAFVIFALATLNVAAAANLTSTVNRNEVSTNETLTLTVSIDQQVDSSELDLSPLQENFEVLAATPQTRSSFNMINGQAQQTASTTWSITLVAKSEGILTIPAFNLKSATSKPISIRVSNRRAGKSSGKSSALPLDVTVSSGASEVYPNQQFIITVELSSSSNVRDLSGPQLVIADADVEAFDQQNFQRVDNGIARQIVILKYAVFAKQAGQLTVPIMTYTGLQNGRRSVFGNSGTQVIARSQSIEIEVKETPETGNRQWFPAQDVSITSKWSGDASGLNVGEPITRTITVTARGQIASAIPPLEQLAIDAELKSYKDQPQLETKKSNQGFVATRVESEAIVANKAGEYVLPALSIDWWNSNTKQWQTSTVEPQTLIVTGEALPTVSLVAPIETESTPTSTTHINNAATNNSASTRLWQIISALLALIVAVQFYFLIKRPKPKLVTNKDQHQNVSEKAAWSSLKGAINADNSRAIRNDLLLWGRQVLGLLEPASLDALAQAAHELGVSDGLAEQFKALDAHLYQGGDKPKLAEMEQLLTDLRNKLLKSSANAKKTKVELEPLYPT